MVTPSQVAACGSRCLVSFLRKVYREGGIKKYPGRGIFRGEKSGGRVDKHIDLSFIRS